MTKIINISIIAIILLPNYWIMDTVNHFSNYVLAIVFKGEKRGRNKTICSIALTFLVWKM